MSTIPVTITPTIGGHSDLSFKAALDKIPPEVQHKFKTTAQDFEAVFLGTMFSQMTAGLKGEGPFGNSVGTGVWRSMLTDEYAKSFARAGGIGLSNDVFRAMIMQQAARTA